MSKIIINPSFLKEQLITFLKDLNEQYFFPELVMIQDLIENKNDECIFMMFKEFIETGGKEILENIIEEYLDDDKTQKGFDYVINYVHQKNSKIKKNKILFLIDEIWVKNTNENRIVLRNWLQTFLKIVLFIKKNS